MKAPKTFLEAVQYFSDSDRCLQFLVALRWPRGVVCPHCGHGFAADRSELKRQAAGRVVELEGAERLGELNTLRDMLADQRATIAKLLDEERALRVLDDRRRLLLRGWSRCFLGNQPGKHQGPGASQRYRPFFHCDTPLYRPLHTSTRATALRRARGCSMFNLTHCNRESYGDLLLVPCGTNSTIRCDE